MTASTPIRPYHSPFPKCIVDGFLVSFFLNTIPLKYRHSAKKCDPHKAHIIGTPMFVHGCVYEAFWRVGRERERERSHGVHGGAYESPPPSTHTQFRASICKHDRV